MRSGLPRAWPWQPVSPTPAPSHSRTPVPRTVCWPHCEARIDTTPTRDSVCRNCDRPLVAGWSYCAGCGQKAATGRLTLHEIGHDALHALLHVDRSAWSLLRALALRPGVVARDYVAGRRKRYFGPFAFLIVTVAIGSAAIAVTDFPAVTAGIPNAVASFLQHHVNLLFLLQVPIFAAACRLLTPRGPYNFAEYLVLAAYCTGMRTLFFTVVDVGGWYLLHPSEHLARILYFSLMPVAPLYLAFACAQFLPGSRWLGAAKGAAAAIIAYAATQALVSGITYVIQVMILG